MGNAEQVHEVYEGSVLLRDGASAVIRLLRRDDLPAVQRLHEQLPEHDCYLRFFGFSKHAAREAARLVVSEDSVAVGLFRDGVLEGVANFRGSDPPELAVAIAHAAQHNGVGTLLLEALVALARNRGIHVIMADVLATNSSMHDVLTDSGLDVMRQYDGPVTHLRINVPERIDGTYAAALSRRRHSCVTDAAGEWCGPPYVNAENLGGV